MIYVELDKYRIAKNVRGKTMKKILVFGMTRVPGGMESVIMNYYRNIDRSKIQFDFLCNEKLICYEEEIKKLGGKIYYITARSEDRKRYQKELRDFFKDNAQEYIAIWENTCALNNIDYLKYAKKYNIKYRIIHAHNTKIMQKKLIKKTLFTILHYFNKLIISKYATDFWACSEKAGKFFYTEKIRKSNKYKIINNAIDTEKFKFNGQIRNEYRKKMNLEDKIVIGNVGRLHFQKNQNFLIDVFNEIYKENKNVELILVGGGEDRKLLEDKVKNLHIEQAVKFLGIRNDVNNLIQAMDIFVFPSYFEGLSVTLIEAYASGIKIIASKEAINDKKMIFENVKRVSLKEDIVIWKKRIIDKINNVILYDREKESENNIENIKKIGFDIKEETKIFDTIIY